MIGGNQIKKTQKLIFLCGHRKAGTTLIRNLLDGHTSLAVYPNDLGILYQYFPYFILNENDKSKLKSRLKKFLFDNQKHVLFSQFDEVQKNYFNLWENKFLYELDKYSVNDLKNLSKIIHLLSSTFYDFYTKMFCQSKPKYLVFKETLIEINAYNYYNLFKDIYFIQIIRDPRINFLSLIKGINNYYSKKNENINTILMGLIYRMKLSMNAAKNNLNLIGDKRYKVIKYENLVSNKTKILSEISNWLNLDMEKMLEYPTLFSKRESSNSFYNKNVNFVFDNNNNGLSKIEDKYISIIEFFLKNEMTYFQYDELMTLEKQAKYMGEFYNWSNYQYFYNDFYK